MVNEFIFKNTSMDGLKVIEPFCVHDDRGYFSKTYERDIFRENGINMVPYEELRSVSKKGVLRGLHFQSKNCQDKLVQVVSGQVYDVVVDLRGNSDTFGKWEGFYLSGEKRNMLYIPKGFAHGFLALEDNTLFSYLCGAKYDPSSDGGIRWNDYQIDIQWPLDKVDSVIMTVKDKKLPMFDEFIKICGSL